MTRAFQIRGQAKQLEREARRLLKESNKERQRVKSELSRGNRATASLYAQNAVRYQQLLQSAAAVNVMVLDMKAAHAAARTAKTMGVAAGAMRQATAQVNLAQLSKNHTKMDGLKQQMGAAQEMLIGEGEVQLQAGGEALLAELEEENNALAMMAIATIPKGILGLPAPTNQGRYSAH